MVAGHRLGEPAQRPGAQPAQHDARLPRLAQRDVEPVRAQHAHQADRRCRRRRRRGPGRAGARARRRSRSRAGTARRATARSGSPRSAGRSGRRSGRRRRRRSGGSRPSAGRGPPPRPARARSRPGAGSLPPWRTRRHRRRRSGVGASWREGRDRSRSAREFRALGREPLWTACPGAAQPPKRQRSACTLSTYCCVSSYMPRSRTELQALVVARDRRVLVAAGLVEQPLEVHHAGVHVVGRRVRVELAAARGSAARSPTCRASPASRRARWRTRPSRC